MKMLATVLLSTFTTLSSIYAAPAFELAPLKLQKPYVLELRYGTHEPPQAHVTSTEPSAEFLANASSLSLSVAATDSGQVSSGPFAFGFTLAPEQTPDTYEVAFQGEYQLKDSGKSFQGATLVPLNEWVLLAETSITTLTSSGAQRQAFSVAMRLRQD